MQIDLDKDNKICSVFVNNNELINNEFPIEVENELDKYRNKKYRVCIYQSGTNDIKKDFLNLILNNVQL